MISERVRDITGSMTPEPVDSKFPLRMTASERATVEAIQADAQKAGIGVSLNDVLRHLIRRSAVLPAVNESQARADIVAHWKDCPTCNPTEKPQCLDGVRLQRAHARIVTRETIRAAASKKAT